MAVLHKLRRFRSLPVRSQWLLVEAALVLGWTRANVVVLPFPVLRGLNRLLAERGSARPNGRTPVRAADEVAWAVAVASRNLPGETRCLPQALTAQLMLLRRGARSHVRVGVARDADGAIASHAWLEVDGRVVVGGADSPERFTAMPSVFG